MSRLRNPAVVLLRHPVPVTIGPGGFLPILILAALFGLISAHAGLPVAAATVLGALGGTASLLAHEIGHVRAARKATGLRPIGVSLIWLGAVTRFEGAYASGRDQARVAMGGPNMSFGIALALAAPLFVVPVPLGLKEIVLALVLFNVGLGVVSLIPANPLDGYKVIVGLLWSMLGSEAGARRLIRRAVMPWVVVELLGTSVLLVERPFLGVTVVAIGASLFGQNRFTRRRA
jgi:Zn-dependent protease